MSKIQLYIATSIDGYIARKDGALDWLDNMPNPAGSDFGYTDFYEGVDTVIMGRKTYEEVLGFGVDWPYPDCKSLIATSQKDYEVNTPNTHVINDISQQSIDQIKNESHKNVWLIGGGDLVKHFLELEVLDEMFICVVPTLIGEGIPLFVERSGDRPFELSSSEAFPGGAVMMTYRRKS